MMTTRHLISGMRDAACPFGCNATSNCYSVCLAAVPMWPTEVLLYCALAQLSRRATATTPIVAHQQCVSRQPWSPRPALSALRQTRSEDSWSRSSWRTTPSRLLSPPILQPAQVPPPQHQLASPDKLLQYTMLIRGPTACLEWVADALLNSHAHPCSCTGNNRYMPYQKLGPHKM